MPKKFEDCVRDLRDKGYSLEKAYAICQVSVNKAKVRNPGGNPPSKDNPLPKPKEKK